MTTTVVNINHEPCDVYVGRANPRRGLRASGWANPYRMADGYTRDEAISLYQEHLANSPNLLKALPELRGKRLGCYCKPLDCHGDILAQMADEGQA